MIVSNDTIKDKLIYWIRVVLGTMSYELRTETLLTSVRFKNMRLEDLRAVFENFAGAAPLFEINL